MASIGDEVTRGRNHLNKVVRGMFVAIGDPEAPLTSRFGNAAGSTSGWVSWLS